MKLKFLSWILLTATFGLLPAATQADSSLVINAANIRQLESVQQIDFAGLPEGVGQVESGWFVLNPWGDQFIVKSRSEHLITLDRQGRILADYAVMGTDGFPATIMDAAFDLWGASTVTVHASGDAFYVVKHYGGTSEPYTFKVPSKDVPIRVWQSFDGGVLVEMTSTEPGVSPYILEILAAQPFDFHVRQVELDPDEYWRNVSGPENDPESYLRIGRIEPPFAITVTQYNILKWWNLEWGEEVNTFPSRGGVVLRTYQLDSLPGMGAINIFGVADDPPTTSHFAWRDGASTELHLLDFESGEDQVIVLLGGTYIPFLLLTAGADVIIGVNVGDQPNVVAWDVGTGERIDLGEYRACNRQPDMVRLSRDGSTLVIGCDTGLDIWRVVATSN